MKKPTQYKIVGPPEKQIVIKFPKENDFCDFFVEVDNVEDTEIPTLLDIVSEQYQEELVKAGRKKVGGELKRKKVYEEAEIQMCDRFEVFGSPDGVRRMPVDHGGVDLALYVKDWDSVDIAKTSGVSPGRPKKVQDVHKENARDNWDQIKDNDSIEEFYGAFEDKCVVIAGSGPSLRRTHEHIPNDDDFVVIAINEAADTIPDEKIDFVYALDREAKPKWVQGISDDVTCISSVVTPKEYLDNFEEVRFFRYPQTRGGDDAFINRDIEHLNVLDCGKTATYSAFHFAFLSGAPVINFIGQDFSCTSEMYSSQLPMTPERYQQGDYFQTADIDGSIALTNKRFTQNMRYVKGQAAFVGQSGTYVVNGSGRGILDLESYPNNEMAGGKNVNLQPRDAIEFCRQVLNEKENVEVRITENSPSMTAVTQ